MRIAIVAGEVSGDLLGEGLVRALKRKAPDLILEGIGGDGLLGEGLRSLHPMEALSVMGLTEVLGSLPQLLRLRRQLAERWIADPPDLFIGIDAPEFNLGLERRLREHGIPTVHYVSPSVWAWREGRIKIIRRAVDLMLTLFPFERAFYERHGVRAAFVGHPAADRLAEPRDRAADRAALGLPAAGQVVALLPGSRMSEVSRLAPVFAQAAAQLRSQRPELRFVAPIARPHLREAFAGALRAAGVAEAVTLTEGGSERAMGAADVVLLASGTATLEAMLIGRPMVVAYKVAPVSYFIFRGLGLVKIDRFALPNLLAGEELVPEFIQGAATPAATAAAVAGYLDSPARCEALAQRFEALRAELHQSADERAAEAIWQWLSQRS